MIFWQKPPLIEEVGEGSRASNVRRTKKRISHKDELNDDSNITGIRQIARVVTLRARRSKCYARVGFTHQENSSHKKTHRFSLLCKFRWNWFWTCLLSNSSISEDNPAASLKLVAIILQLNSTRITRLFRSVRWHAHGGGGEWAAERDYLKSSRGANWPDANLLILAVSLWAVIAISSRICERYTRVFIST